MSTRQEFKFGGKNIGNAIGGIIILSLVFIALFFVAKGIFTVLSWVAPVLLILTLIIDYTVIVDFGKYILKLFKNNFLAGILAVLLTVVGFPIVAGFLFFRSIIRRKIGKMMEQHAPKEIYSEYEVVEEEVDFLELPEIQKQAEKQKPEDNEYEDLFE